VFHRLEQVTQITYLGCSISYQFSNDVKFNLAKFLQLIFTAWCLVFLAFLFFSDEQGAGPLHQPPNLEGQVIFGQVFLPLALDNSLSNCRAAVLVLFYPGYFISPVPTISGERSLIRHLGRRPMGD